MASVMPLSTSGEVAGRSGTALYADVGQHRGREVVDHCVLAAVGIAERLMEVVRKEDKRG